MSSTPTPAEPSPLAAMRALTPPPADLARDPSLREWVFEFDVPVPPMQLWATVSDTSRVNRALGLDTMQFEEQSGVLRGRNRSLGIEQRWVEEPWSWVKGSYLTSVRRYERGLARAVFAAYRLEPTTLASGGTRVEGTRFRVYFAWAPRGLVGRLLLGLGMRWVGARYREVVGELASRGGLAALPAPEPPELGEAARGRLLDLAARLRERGLDAASVDAIVALVTNGDELELDRIAPLERARTLGVDERALVETCLHATRVGLLDMRWDVVCPLCRGVRASLTQLGDLPTSSRCEVCDATFRTSDEHAVEVTFRPHPAVRPVERRFYCSAEPATKQHIELQLTVPPKGRAVVPTTLGPGLHRMRTKGGASIGRLDVFADRPTGVELDLAVGALPDAVVVGASPALLLRNDDESPVTFVVESPAWPDTALRPGYLLGMQGFRDLFTDQYLAAGVQIEVGEQTILFTDIVGSTEFYASVGDPAAFAAVKQHFDRLFAIVAEHRGAVVKTIGDATMAAFSSPVDALAASAAMQRAFPPDAPTPALRIRISLHTGSCIAVQFHQGIDFFGGTVNVAAKLQALAHAGQLVLSDATHASPGVVAELERLGATLEDVSYDSPALGGAVRAKRWQIVG